MLATEEKSDHCVMREKLDGACSENCEVLIVDAPEIPAACVRLPELTGGTKGLLSAPPVVAAFDLESVLVPEIWETIAQVAGVPQLALTTRDVSDYAVLMDQRIRLCRENGLSLAKLGKIVAAMEPLPGAVEFLAWVQRRMLAVIVSDTYHELAGPVVEKLGSPLMICNALIIDELGYISGHRAHHSMGKAGAIQHFQMLGFQTLAVGDSYNDLGMLQTADAGILLRPCPGLVESAGQMPIIWNLKDLKAEIEKLLLRLR